MENTNDLLTAFSEPETNRNKRFVRIVVILFTIYNIIYLIAFFISLQIGRIDLSMLFSSIPMALRTLILRLLPIVALVMFIAKKKAGWILVLLFSITDLLFRAVFFVIAVLNFKAYLYVSSFLMISILSLFLLSIAVTFFTLIKPVTLEFRITGVVKFLTILGGVIFFIALDIYSNKLLQKLLSAF